MKTYSNLSDALRYVLEELSPRGHKYIVDVRGPDGMSAGQFVAECMVYGGNCTALALFLAFDTTCESKSVELERFQACQVFPLFEYKPWQDIPCYASRFGLDVSNALRVYWQVASRIYYNADSMVLECTVHDEGPA